MDDLHKPLGNAETQPTKRGWVRPASAFAGIALIALTGYLYFEGRSEDVKTVSLAEDNQSIGNDQAAKAEQVDAERSGSQGEVEEFDISQVKPLTPLVPDSSSTTTTNEQPVFKPVLPPQKRISNWLPDPDLVEESEFGLLPRISTANVRPLDAYSQSSGISGANRVALIVGGLGLSQTGTQAAIKALPSSISLGFSPLGNSLQRWVQEARREGHEVVLQLPMEPLGYPTINPGPRTLVSVAEEGENLMNLRWSLGRMTNYPVVMNYLGAGLTSKSNLMRPLLKEIRDRGLGYIDDGSASASVSLNVAQDLRLPHASGNIIVDAVREPDRMRANLRVLESLAKARGFAIGTASAFPETVEVIAEWAEQADKRNILIVPVSNLLKDYGR
ncbi:MAG: divergent polysaccharide deacetylase family protein [Rhizobiaceae bacterium]